jgi:hypothetical protein
MYPVLTSGFILAVSATSFFEWRNQNKRNNLLLALWLMPLIILLYISLIWILAPFGVGFEGKQGYYLVIPAIAASLFMATFLIAIYDKVREQKNRFLRFFLFCLTILIFSSILFLDRSNINNYFSIIRDDGRYAVDQDKIYNDFSQQLNVFQSKENNLFYFEAPGDALHSSFYYEQSLIDSLPSKMLVKNGLAGGCVAIFNSGMTGLKKVINNNNGVAGVAYNGQCGRGFKGDTKKIFYPFDNFYAFRVKGGEFVNIKNEILNNSIFSLR